MTVGMTGYGTYVPEPTITGREIAERSGIPEEVVVEKMGIERKHVCPPDSDHVTDMGEEAAREALAGAGVNPEDLDLVLYHGSEFKDYIVWSAAAEIAHRIGATDAYANEMYALCAGAPLALRSVSSRLEAGDIDVALLVAASREEDLVEYTDEDASFMFNFGSGASAAVLERDPGERILAEIHESAAITDGSFARDVIMPAGGSVHPPSPETLDGGMHHLTVRDPDDMKERLSPVTKANFLEVADTSLERSGFHREDVDFVALTHMKRSFHDELTAALGLDEEGSFYLSEHGHVQSADQLLAIDEVVGEDRLESGDIVLFLAAGTGYTWAASTLRWLD
ncbi:MAG: 3-oxoacyl-ACP synthase [Halodesulfurarchaeum sp.]